MLVFIRNVLSLKHYLHSVTYMWNYSITWTSKLLRKAARVCVKLCEEWKGWGEGGIVRRLNVGRLFGEDFSNSLWNIYSFQNTDTKNLFLPMYIFHVVKVSEPQGNVQRHLGQFVRAHILCLTGHRSYHITSGQQVCLEITWKRHSPSPICCCLFMK